MDNELEETPEIDAPPADNDPMFVVQDIMGRLMDAADVGAVYGAPVRSSGTLILPAAEVVAFAGFGVGSGAGVDDDGQMGSGGGGGGGGQTFSRPVAVIIATSEGVQVRPVIDLTKIALAALTTAAFMVTFWGQLARGPRR